MKDAEKTVGTMLDKQSVAWIGSVSPDGFPNIKAMLRPRKRDGIRTIYFTTNTSSMRVGQFRENPKACVYVCDSRFFRGAMPVSYTHLDVYKRQAAYPRPPFPLRR